MQHGKKECKASNVFRYKIVYYWRKTITSDRQYVVIIDNYRVPVKNHWGLGLKTYVYAHSAEKTWYVKKKITTICVCRDTKKMVHVYGEEFGIEYGTKIQRSRRGYQQVFQPDVISSKILQSLNQVAYMVFRVACIVQRKSKKKQPSALQRWVDDDSFDINLLGLIQLFVCQ